MERPLTRHIRFDAAPFDIDAYEKAGGYAGLRKALTDLSPQEVVKMVDDSHLRGRGGAGFPTGKKWSFVPMGDDAVHPKYLVVNGDEMEPGTFKDRLLMEGNPHQLVEGTIIGAYAIGADIAYIFVRQAYANAARRLKKAISEAYGRGYLGRRILGSGYSLDLHLHVSAGRYICGEETALLTALEGRRPLPRAKPPFPPVVGLWGKPTIANNVETICNVAHIVTNGANWFRGLSLSEDGGTKIYGVSGRVKRPGSWELPMGTPMRRILEENAGGMQDGYRFRGLIPGGASTEFLLEEHMDVKMDFDAVGKVGSRLGTGCMVVLDDKTCPVGMVLNLIRFFARESCGWCTPCREGLPRIERILRAMEDGRGSSSDIDTLKAHTRWLGPGHTFCMLAPGAMEPLQSALAFFESDFVRHIEQNRCPWK